MIPGTQTMPTSKKKFHIGSVPCGGERLFMISGPCVIESESIMFKTAEALKELSERLNLPVIFKSSFMKDNRSDLGNFHGPGLDAGLKMLAGIREQFQLPVTTDVHFATQVAPVSDVVDVIQIPAYLCMQSSLLTEAAQSGRAVNVKHGQFLAPENMAKPVKKLEDAGAVEILVTERGYTFGYNDLIVDPRSFYHLNRIGYPVIFDITHSIRRYGIPSKDPKGSSREYLPVISRAGVAAGVDGIFVETHPDPAQALCDAASQIQLDQLEGFIRPLMEIHALVRSLEV
jgi:2-dehydro-3-deoxyphosphooctonate aldolase (KDO 8-P synthase)